MLTSTALPSGETKMDSLTGLMGCAGFWDAGAYSAGLTVCAAAGRTKASSRAGMTARMDIYFSYVCWETLQMMKTIPKINERKKATV